MNNSNGHFGGIITAFLSGAAVGAAVALLTSPRSGTENRLAVKGYVQNQTHSAGKLPAAVQAASGAAKEAFAESMHKNTGNAGAV
jgi:gas vesicle protein